MLQFISKQNHQSTSDTYRCKQDVGKVHCYKVTNKLYIMEIVKTFFFQENGHTEISCRVSTLH